MDDDLERRPWPFPARRRDDAPPPAEPLRWVGVDLASLPEIKAAPPSQLDRIEAALAQLRGKLDTLIAALGEEPEQEAEPGATLDGDTAGGERDQTQGL